MNKFIIFLFLQYSSYIPFFPRFWYCIFATLVFSICFHLAFVYWLECTLPFLVPIFILFSSSFFFLFSLWVWKLLCLFLSVDCCLCCFTICRGFCLSPFFFSFYSWRFLFPFAFHFFFSLFPLFSFVFSLFSHSFFVPFMTFSFPFMLCGLWSLGATEGVRPESPR